MELNIIQCDRCRTRSKNREGWSKFQATFSTDESPEPSYDLCPDCVVKFKASIDELLSDRPIPTLPEVAPCLESIKLVEQRHILHVLTAKDWNKSHAARILGIERSTLDRKLKAYKASRPGPELERLNQLELMHGGALHGKTIAEIVLAFELPEDLQAQLTPFNTWEETHRSTQARIDVLTHVAQWLNATT